MAKKLVILSFLVSFIVALWTYASRDTRSLRDNLVARQKDPRVIIEDFYVFRYRRATLSSRLTAKLGLFFEPNVLEIEGEIRAGRYNQGRFETLSAESARATFDAKTLGVMMSQKVDLNHADLSGFVEVGVKNHVLSTDHAEFSKDDQIVRSTRPVRVDGPGRVFMGEDGFSYSLVTETLEMPGVVKGELKIDEAK